MNQTAVHLYVELSQLLFILTLVTSFVYRPANGNNDVTDQKSENHHNTPRSRAHLETILQMDEVKITRREHIKETLDEVVKIYRSSIKPVAELYHFTDLNRHMFSAGEIRAKPLVLLVGPWSTGKSTMINYLLGITDSKHSLLTGAEPTTSDFTVMMHGENYKTVEGLVLVTDPNKQFSALEKFGKGFVEKFQGVELPNKLLEHMTLVDTPGIIENRKQQERGYPFNDVMRWFMDRADLILVIFDPSKLDVGAELESLFTELKGHESQIRIVLNKADTLTPQELMRVYGALFWNLAPLINVTEPPRVYVGSFWQKAFKEGTNHDLFLAEEVSLLLDVQQTMNNVIENKIALMRQHAVQVRLHALIVDKYLATYNAKYSMFADTEAILNDIVDQPEDFNIFQSLQSKPYVSKYDLPPTSRYKDFFAINALNSFKTLDSHCSVFSGCILDALTGVIARDLPNLLNQFKNFKCESDVCDES